MKKKFPTAYEFGVFRLSVKDELLYENGNRVDLSPTGIKMLMYLIENRGTFCKADELITEIWGPNHFLEKNNIPTHINAIRRAVGDDKRERRLIDSVRKKGYCFDKNAITHTDYEYQTVSIEQDISPKPDTSTEQDASLKQDVPSGADASTEQDISPEPDTSTERDAGSEPGTSTEQDTPSAPNTSTGPDLSSRRAGSFFQILKRWRDSNKFNSWLFDLNNKFMWMIVFYIAVTLVIYFLSSAFYPLYSVSAVSAAQAAVLLILLTLQTPGPEGVNERMPSAEEWNNLSPEQRGATRYPESFDEFKDAFADADDKIVRYKLLWKLVLIFWFSLYVVFIFAALPQFGTDNLRPEKSAVVDQNVKDFIIFLDLVRTLFNNISSGAIFLCFFTLNSISQFKNKMKLEIDSALGLTVLTIFIFTVAESVIVWTQDNDYQILKVFSGLSGIAAATVMMLWFARLQSRYQNAPGWLIVSLFTYTALQPLFLFIDMENWGVWIMILALFFKCLLFLYMTFLFHNWRFHFYFIHVRNTRLNVEKQFEDFTSIFSKPKT